MEIVDGELEVLAAGEWRSFSPGVHPYEVRGAAAKSLPRGQFTLTVDEHIVRLEWKPAAGGNGAGVTREFRTDKGK
jgi:hypothetical protein